MSSGQCPFNFQSCKNKVSELEILINTTDPDIIIGNETCLKTDIKSTEIFPPTFNQVYRRDRIDGHGGVLIALKNNLVSTQIHVSENVELIATQ